MKLVSNTWMQSDRGSHLLPICTQTQRYTQKHTNHLYIEREEEGDRKEGRERKTERETATEGKVIIDTHNHR